MWTAQDCRKQAAEAEGLAHTVALGSDQARLQQQADAWRLQAEQIEARERTWAASEPPSALTSLRSWFGRSPR